MFLSRLVLCAPVAIFHLHEAPLRHSCTFMSCISLPRHSGPRGKDDGGCLGFLRLRFDRVGLHNLIEPCHPCNLIMTIGCVSVQQSGPYLCPTGYHGQ